MTKEAKIKRLGRILELFYSLEGLIVFEEEVDVDKLFPLAENLRRYDNEGSN